MNRIIYNTFILLFLIIIISCAFSENTYKETFIPKVVKETYRPIERNIRMTYEGFYDKTSTDISNLFRKFGIL
jgi:hypothetical protein